MQKHISIIMIIFALFPSSLRAQSEFDEKVIDAILRNPEVIVAALEILKSAETEKQRQVSMELVERRSADLFDRALPGNLNPEVEPLIIEFFDYRCGYCSVGSPTTETFAALNDRRIRLIELPILGPASKELAEISIAVRNSHETDDYFAFRQRLMDPQTTPRTKEMAWHIISEMGLDEEAIKKAQSDGGIASEINRNIRLAEAMGINGTPAYVGRSGIGVGSRSLEQLKELGKIGDPHEN